MRTDSNNNVALIVALVIISVTLGSTRGTDAIGGPSRDLQISNQRDESLSETLLHMRHQIKSLFSDWNLGESEGKINGFRSCYYFFSPMISKINSL